MIKKVYCGYYKEGRIGLDNVDWKILIWLDSYRCGIFGVYSGFLYMYNV